MRKKLAILMMATSLVLTNGITALADTAQETQAEVHHNEGYDPEHPLAGKIDDWNLRLPATTLGAAEVSTSNIQAMLTGQMEQYYAAPIGESVNPTTGTRGYVSEDDYNNTRKYENDLYNWYCNWLNGMDFENMSEMDRAKEIKTVLASASYDTSSISYGETTEFRYDYAVLISQKGRCTEFAMAAKSLATALGLKSSVSGYGDHTVYYIWVDGECYMGSNQGLNLDYPSDLNHQSGWTDPRW